RRRGRTSRLSTPPRAAGPPSALAHPLPSIFPRLHPPPPALSLTSATGPRLWRHLGLDARSPGRDLGWGLALGAVIGIPGLGLYLAGRALGVSLEVSTSGLADHWWTIPMLILAAAKNGILEEVLVVGYLTERLRRLRWGA